MCKHETLRTGNETDSDTAVLGFRRHVDRVETDAPPAPGAGPAHLCLVSPCLSRRCTWARTCGTTPLRGAAAACPWKTPWLCWGATP